MRGVMLVVFCGLVFGLLPGCGGEEDDIVAQTDRLANEMFGELDSAAFETEFDAPRGADCFRPRLERFVCIVYFKVADDVALTAEYKVRDCGLGWRALAVDAHERLRVPAKLQHEREFDATCAWASSGLSGSFLEIDEVE